MLRIPPRNGNSKSKRKQTIVAPIITQKFSNIYGNGQPKIRLLQEATPAGIINPHGMNKRQLVALPTTGKQPQTLGKSPKAVVVDGIAMTPAIKRAIVLLIRNGAKKQRPNHLKSTLLGAVFPGSKEPQHHPLVTLVNGQGAISGRELPPEKLQHLLAMLHSATLLHGATMLIVVTLRQFRPTQTLQQLQLSEATPCELRSKVQSPMSHTPV